MNRIRASLLASVTGIGLAVSAAPALAQDGPALDQTQSQLESQGSGSVGIDQSQTLLEAQNTTVSGPEKIMPEPQIVIANPNTPTTARDPDNITGVGQMVVDEGGGFVGLCTASLINPRTVIFAAHCVNSQAATSYGAANGGTAIGFGFSNSNLPAIQAWFNSGFQTNTANAYFNSNWVNYNAGSLEPNAAGFLYSDVAVAALDTPAEDIPTWALLFSALPAPASIGASGTGYHVTIEGYGNNGTGTSGSSGGIDFRRRIAENILGGLASLDQFENYLFGGAASDNPQNLYWIDFDDPRRGTSSTPSVYDFNAWRDNAVSDGKEGITASGDSGGPLILDQAYATKLILGVLSGGYTRFFTGQPANGYGTVSFYQPLYLYWDWVAANNPYHYVSAKAGDGNWMDPNHWVSLQDPNYYILDSNGNLINGTPSTPGEGKTGNDGTFGQACFQGAIAGGSSDCLDMSTGVETFDPVHPIGTDLSTGGATTASISGTAGNDYAVTSIEDASQSSQIVSRDTAELEAQGAGGTQTSAAALPAPTIDNGLPGATNFVPVNYDGNSTNKPRYFDVNLSASGTTTLDASSIVVDRLRITGAGAGLKISSTGILTSLMDIMQLTGTMTVNGTLATPGDYFLMTGGLTGSGTIRTAYLTNVAGTIAPGTPNGGIGTLNIYGNLVLSSGSTLMIDLGPNGTSDRIQVQSNGTGSGQVSRGGNILFTWTNSLRNNQVFTILTAQSGSGLFNTPAPFSAILYPYLVYTANGAVTQVQVRANAYTGLISDHSSPAYQYAQLLDQSRSIQSQYDALYGPLDLADAATIRATLASYAPTTETMIQSLGIASVESMGGFIRDRVASLDTQSLGGTVAHYGAPIQVASYSLNRTGPYGMGGAIASDTAPTSVDEGVLPETMSAFFAGGYINGDSASMPGALGTGRDNFDGWYVAGGVEANVSDSGVLGFSVGYSNLDATGAMAGQTAKGELIQGTLYGKVDLGGVMLDSMFGAGLFTAKTERTASVLSTPYTLTSKDNALVVVGEAGLSKKISAGMVDITPRIAGRATQIGFTMTAESGGPMALLVDRPKLDSIQGRAGLTIAGNGSQFKPYLSGTYVHEFEDKAPVIGANLVGGVYGFAPFVTSSQDKDYGEVSGGLTYTSGKVDISVSAQSTVFRSDVSNQTYRGSIAFHF